MAENKRFTLKHYEDTDWAYDNGKSIYTKEMVELLNEQDETIAEQDETIADLKSIKNKYKGQRDYLLFVIERCCTKEKFEETKSYLQYVEDNYG